ncbi:hypothetical protein [Mesorhizobium caraganae]|uniref:hypothetical protein n=1 Tax=Mesorhizobium caraganae TaxID=483206 RepID=UPI00177CBA2B|nr:hypothetical protein [Mesorhizobium caraganae]
MATHTDENGTFTCPPVVESLDDMPQDFRGAYAVDPDRPDQFLLTAEGHELRALYEELASLTAETKSLEARDAKLTKNKRTLEATLLAAIASAGVKPAFQEGVSDILQRRHKFTVQPSDDGSGPIVMAETAYGAFPVETIVSSFLGSDDGLPYRQKKSGATAGMFTQMINKLR